MRCSSWFSRKFSMWGRMSSMACQHPVMQLAEAMPVMTQVSIAARAYKADANYVAVMTALTTVIALFTIPTYFILLTYGIL